MISTALFIVKLHSRHAKQTQRPAAATGSTAASSVAVAGCPAATQPTTAGGVRPLMALEEGDMIPLRHRMHAERLVRTVRC